jgi:hypothetical protein
MLLVCQALPQATRVLARADEALQAQKTPPPQAPLFKFYGESGFPEISDLEECKLLLYRTRARLIM